MKTQQARRMVDEAIDRLAASLERGESATLKAYLAMMGRFRRYSLGNQLLIALARPEATRVAGFHTWRKMGHTVKQGEKGIRILAPIVGWRRCTREDQVEDKEATVTQASTVEADAEAGRERVVVGFRVVVVFDESQTEGRALPRFAEVSGDVSEFLPRLLAWAEQQGIAVSFTDSLGPAQGMALDGRVLVRSDLSEAESFSTLAHELAHVRLHQSGDCPASRTVRETEAEAVAFVVCHTVGLDTSTSSEDYIRLYRGDKTLLMASLTRIRDTAMEILAAIEATPATARLAAGTPGSFVPESASSRAAA